MTTKMEIFNPQETLSRLDFLAEVTCDIVQIQQKTLYGRDTKSISKFIAQSAFIHFARGRYHCSIRTIEAYLNLSYTIVHKRDMLVRQHLTRSARGAKIPFVQTYTLKAISAIKTYLDDLRPENLVPIILPEEFNEEVKTKAVTFTVEATGVPRYKTKHGFIDSKGQIILRPPE